MTSFQQDKSLKITFVFHGAELGGAERQGLFLARFLLEQYEAKVEAIGLMAEGPGRVADLCKKYGINWSPVPIKWVNAGMWSRLSGLFKVIKYLRRTDADIILPYTVFPNIICGLIWRLTKASTCVWNQRDEGMYLDSSFWCRFAVKSMPKFISNSIKGRDVLHKIYGLPRNKIVVLPNAVRLTAPKASRNEWRKRHRISTNQFIACMVANLHKFKDHRTLIKAWQLVLEDAQVKDLKPKLLIVGRFDGMVNDLMELTDHLSLKEFIVFLGEIDDVPGVLAASDLYVHSSYYEGMPNAVLEAMINRLPVVASDIPGIRACVGPDGEAFLAPPQSPRALAQIILKFMADPKLRNQVGEKMFNRCAEKFDFEMIMKETAQVIIGAENNNVKKCQRA